MNFEILVVAPVGTDGGFVFTEGETIDADITNNDTDAHIFKSTLLGWLYRV